MRSTLDELASLGEEKSESQGWAVESQMLLSRSIGPAWKCTAKTAVTT
jgi:hypothetical protein